MLKAMFCTQRWNRNSQDAACEHKDVATFEKRQTAQRTTFADVYRHHAFACLSGSGHSATSGISALAPHSNPTTSSPTSSAAAAVATGSTGATSLSSPSPTSSVPSVVPNQALKDIPRLKAKDCEFVLDKRASSLKGHDTRERKGRTSSPIHPGSWAGCHGGLVIAGLTLAMFRGNHASTRVPLQVRHKGLRLVTSDDQRVVASKDWKQDEKELTLGQLSKIQRNVTVVGISYSFPTLGQRVFRFKGRGHWLNLRPKEPWSSAATKMSGKGVELRDAARMELDFTSGEITYCPSSGEFQFHSPLSTRKLVFDRKGEAEEVKQQEQERQKKRSQNKGPAPKPTQPLDSPVDFATIYNGLPTRENSGFFLGRHRRIVRRLRRQIPHVFRPGRGAAPSHASATSAGCSSASSSPPSSSSSSTSSSAVSPPLTGKARVTWTTGLDEMPLALRHWDPGVDAFGVPYLGVTRHPDETRRPTFVEMTQTTSFGGGKLSVSGDPNIKSFYDFYLPNSGSVVDVGRGWAQRVLQKWGRQMDKLQSDMDTSVQTELNKMVGRQGMTMTLLKQEKAKLIQSLQTNAGPYRSKFAQLQKVNDRTCFHAQLGFH